MKICPKCQLNWIFNDKEDLCAICKKESVKREAPKKYLHKGGALGNGYYNFLAERGYKEETWDGRPSTIHSYIKAIEKVCQWEKMTWLSLAQSIRKTVKEYDIGGIKEENGNCSHRTVYNALKQYYYFLKKEKII